MSENQLSKMLTIKGDVNKSDIVDVGVARIDMKLTIEERTLSDQLTDMQKTCKDRFKELNEAVHVFVKDKIGDDINEVNKALRVVGFKSLLGIDSENFDADEGLVKIVVSASVGKYDTKTAEHEWKASATIKSIHRAWKKAKEQEQEAHDLLRTVRRKKARVPDLERQLRAKLAEASLRETETGQTLLDLLDDATDEFLPLLGLE